MAEVCWGCLGVNLGLDCFVDCVTFGCREGVENDSWQTMASLGVEAMILLDKN